MSDSIEMVTDFCPREIGELFANRNLDYAEFTACYSQRNPLSVNECTDKCFDPGDNWLALLFRFQGQAVAMHHAANRSRAEQYCWTSGFWRHSHRGEIWHTLQAKVWALARGYFAARYTRIYCVAYCHNPWADQWIRERCGFITAAKMRQGVVDHTGARQDIWLYSQREQDVGHCIETAQHVFPDNEGIEKP